MLREVLLEMPEFHPVERGFHPGEGGVRKLEDERSVPRFARQVRHVPPEKHSAIRALGRPIDAPALL